MERRTLSLLAPVLGIASGLVAWFMYPRAFEIVASPVSDMVITFDQEVLRYRLLAGAAFFLLGLVVPITAGMLRGFRAGQRFGGTLSWVCAAACGLVLLTAWWLHHDLSITAEFVSSFAAEDPSIPNVIGYSMVPLYRLATVPAIILLVAGVIGWISELIRGPKNDQRPRRVDSDGFGG